MQGTILVISFFEFAVLIHGRGGVRGEAERCMHSLFVVGTSLVVSEPAFASAALSAVIS